MRPAHIYILVCVCNQELLGQPVAKWPAFAGVVVLAKAEGDRGQLRERSEESRQKN